MSRIHWTYLNAVLAFALGQAAWPETLPHWRWWLIPREGASQLATAVTVAPDGKVLLTSGAGLLTVLDGYEFERPTRLGHFGRRLLLELHPQVSDLRAVGEVEEQLRQVDAFSRIRHRDDLPRARTIHDSRRALPRTLGESTAVSS